MVNELDCVESGLSCANICRTLDRGMDGRKLNVLGRSVGDAINQLNMWVEPAIHISGPSVYHTLDHRTVAEIQKKITKQSGRHRVSRILHARNFMKKI